MSHVFQDIANYSKKRKISLINAIEKINWDTGYNPEEFLQLLMTKEKNWALSRMIAYMPYTTVRQILTKTFLKENINEEIISHIYPPSRQKSVRLLYSKL
jgi:hypothetical protein